MTDQAPEPLEITLQRLARERDEQDRLYNDALTALDQAFKPPVDVPQPHPLVDDSQLPGVNEAWNTLPSPPDMPGGLKGRLTRMVWRTVAPYFERQLTFNSRVVDHLNRNATILREAHRVEQAMADALRAHNVWLSDFNARLLQLLQKITGYVDTKDRQSGGNALVLNAALSGLAETVAKHRESLESREFRYDARTKALEAAHEELRGMVGVAQQATVVLKREVERLSGVTGPTQKPVHRSAEREGGAFTPALDAYKYVGFEDQFRGSQEDIRKRLESYLPYFMGRADVLDVGCGRGEFLDLLAAHDIKARGIDLNHEMAEVCRARGLDVTEADAVGYLESLDDASLGGVFAAQVVEHLEPAYLLRFLELSFLKLRPGGRVILETLNPACWVAFFESYIRDITHRWPLHPETLKYLVTASGFTKTQIEFRSPVPPQDRLQPLPVAPGMTADATDMVETFNANVDKLNARMFTYLDYAVVGEKR